MMVFRAADVDNNGSVDFPEFCLILEALKGGDLSAFPNVDAEEFARLTQEEDAAAGAQAQKEATKLERTKSQKDSEKENEESRRQAHEAFASNLMTEAEARKKHPAW